MTPSQVYDGLVNEGSLDADKSQAAAINALQRLFDDLEKPTPQQSSWRRLFGSKPPNSKLTGIYLHGPVGRGKTTVMDLFFAQVSQVQKRRVHFHAFMIDVHERLHALKSASSRDDPIVILADRIVAEAKLLCFDEFVVNNIADAMILGRLYEAVVERGGVWVMTSNFEPDLLYKDGLQRARFLPFIEVLKQRNDVLLVDNAQDYRRAGKMILNVYFSPVSNEASARLEDVFDILTGDKRAASSNLAVGSRRIKVNRQVENRVAWFEFDDLFRQPVGPAGFLALAEAFPAVCLNNLPEMSRDMANQARRFMTFVDALYNRGRALYILADVPPERLYPAGAGSDEFHRTVSRLIEMQSEDYLKAAQQLGAAQQVGTA